MIVDTGEFIREKVDVKKVVEKIGLPLSLQFNFKSSSRHKERQKHEGLLNI